MIDIKRYTNLAGYSRHQRNALRRVYLVRNNSWAHETKDEIDRLVPRLMGCEP